MEERKGERGRGMGRRRGQGEIGRGRGGRGRRESTSVCVSMYVCERARGEQPCLTCIINTQLIV